MSGTDKIRIKCWLCISEKKFRAFTLLQSGGRRKGYKRQLSGGAWGAWVGENSRSPVPHDPLQDRLEEVDFLLSYAAMHFMKPNCDVSTRHTQSEAYLWHVHYTYNKERTITLEGVQLPNMKFCKNSRWTTNVKWHWFQRSGLSIFLGPWVLFQWSTGKSVSQRMVSLTENSFWW